MLRRLARRLGYVPASELRELRDRSFRAAGVISQEALPTMARGLQASGTPEHRSYVRVVQALETLM